MNISRYFWILPPCRIRSCLKAPQLYAGVSHQPTRIALPKGFFIFAVSWVYAALLSYVLPHFNTNDISDEWKRLLTKPSNFSSSCFKLCAFVSFHKCQFNVAKNFHVFNYFESSFSNLTRMILRISIDKAMRSWCNMQRATHSFWERRFNECKFSGLSFSTIRATSISRLVATRCHASSMVLT